MDSTELLFDEKIMKECLNIASRFSRTVAPNPMVAAIFVYEDKIIGTGYHETYGKEHAEVNLIKSLPPELLKKGTLYVNLEPCSHFGKTPPCVDLVIKSGIKKVVICNTDPNPLVSNRGVNKLLENNIEVITGILENEGKELNKRHFCFHENKRPYVILKFAQTSDGFIARDDYSSKWISSEKSRELVHRWRSEEQAILVGTKTAQIDNPKLTSRIENGTNPLRLVIDKNLKLDLKLELFNQEVKTVIFNNLKNEQLDNLEYLKIDFNQKITSQVLNYLYEQKIISVIIEGGSFTLNSFITDNLWDEARIFTSETKFVSGILAPKISGKLYKSDKISGDTLDIIYNSKDV